MGRKKKATHRINGIRTEVVAMATRRRAPLRPGTETGAKQGRIHQSFSSPPTADEEHSNALLQTTFRYDCKQSLESETEEDYDAIALDEAVRCSKLCISKTVANREKLLYNKSVGMEAANNFAYKQIFAISSNKKYVNRKR